MRHSAGARRPSAVSSHREVRLHYAERSFRLPAANTFSSGAKLPFSLSRRHGTALWAWADPAVSYDVRPPVNQLEQPIGVDASAGPSPPPAQRASTDQQRPSNGQRRSEETLVGGRRQIEYQYGDRSRNKNTALTGSRVILSFIGRHDRKPRPAVRCQGHRSTPNCSTEQIDIGTYGWRSLDVDVTRTRNCACTTITTTAYKTDHRRSVYYVVRIQATPLLYLVEVSVM